ncbi:MAG TPA: PhnD/SsuA/transferrin family substrate-binding protein [Candidatus Acidoferrum sp.]|nr:PhnD/SsuA/transferrin family substrate-binding protein [Candidatus Acidoferrum sp.]
MTLAASLPMYDLPELRSANAAFVAALRDVLREDAPDDAGDLRLSQMCGYPMQTDVRGQFVTLGTPWYDVPGCEGPAHRAFVVVPVDSPAKRLEDLRGRRFAVNDERSNTGMNLPRRAFAPLSEEGPLFERVIVTGSHAASMALVAAGGADAASIDCVTYGLYLRHRRASVERLRILEWTSPSPAPPFVTPVETSQRGVAALRHALARISSEPRFGPLLRSLHVSSISLLGDEAYDVLLAYEAEAVRQGYPVLR